MKCCTFFGHRDCGSNIKPKLSATLENLIMSKSVDMFYVGNNGGFDRLVRGVLCELNQKYPHIKYRVVLEKMPYKSDGSVYTDTVFPEELTGVHPKFAIDRRNRWMLKRSDVVVVFVNKNYGGAAKFEAIAKRQGKTVINLAES